MHSNATISLFFHNPSRHQFSRVVGWFRKHGYRFLSLEELEGYFVSERRLPEGSVWISLDDAWRRNLTEVIPVIREWDIPITLFVPTDAVLRGTLWFSHVLRNAALLPQPFRKDIQQLWRVPDSTRNLVLGELFQQAPPPEREVMSVEDIIELCALPQVAIGSHSVTHAILPTCTEDEVRRELSESKRCLEQWTGRSIRAFSYPNGDYDERAGPLLAQAGYSLAFTTEPHAISAADERYQMPRCSIMDDGSLTENLCHAFGLWSPVVKAFKRRRPNPQVLCPEPSAEITLGSHKGVEHGL